MSLFHLILFYYCVSDIKDPLLLSTKEQLHIKPSRAKVLILQTKAIHSSHSFGFTCKLWFEIAPLLSVANSTTPVQTTITSYLERTVKSSPNGPPSGPSCPTHPFSPQQPESLKQMSVRLFPPLLQWHPTAPTILKLACEGSSDITWYMSKQLCPPWATCPDTSWTLGWLASSHS